jgi:hypothetical protein
MFIFCFLIMAIGHGPDSGRKCCRHRLVAKPWLPKRVSSWAEVQARQTGSQGQ